MGAPRGPAWSTYAWYAAAGGAIAVGPWMSLHLQDVGLGASTVAAVLLALPLGRLVGTPLWGWVADRVSSSWVLRGSSVLGALFGLGLVLVPVPEVVALCVLGWSISIAPWFPVMDAATVAVVGRNYGRVRAWASIAFLVSVGSVGMVRDAWSAAPLVVSAVLTIISTGLAFQIPVGTTPPKPPGLAAIAALLRHPELRPLLLACAVHGATLASYDLLFAPHLVAVGGSATATGAAFALGVAVEIGVLWVGPRLLGLLGPVGLMWVGLGAGVPRFLVVGLSHDVAVLIGVQALHGLHFGAFWIAATSLFAERAPAELRNTTQALLPAAAYGAGPLAGLTFATLWLQDGDYGSLYVVMAGLSLLACGLLVPLLPPRAPATAG